MYSINCTNGFLECFFEFLRENMKIGFFDFDAFLEDLERQHGESGANFYKLPGRVTKSGNPETFYYETETTFFDENCNEIDPGKNDFAYCETRFYL